MCSADLGTADLGTAFGIDVGGTFIKAVAVSSGGEEQARCSRPTPTERRLLVAAVRAVMDDLRTRSGAQPQGGVGISSPGLADRQARSIRWMQGRMEAVQGLDWSEELGCECSVLNDAHAATLGEAWLGAARGCADVVLLTLGTGIGGGILVGGELLRGHLGRAGHLGHLCLGIDGEPDICSTPGSLEDAVADCGVERRTAGRFRSTKEVVEAAAAGDVEAQQVWSRSVRSLACGIASICNAIDPEVVVLGGGIVSAGDRLFEPLRRELAEVEWRPTDEPVRVVPAQLGEAAGAFGAARFALLRAEPA